MRRPSFVVFPAFLLKLMLGEMAKELLLNGQNVIPKKVLDTGYIFEYPKLNDALIQILDRQDTT